MELDVYEFNNTKNYLQFDKMSGIYAILYKEQVIYVGQSNNIRRRLLAHHSIDSKIKYYAQPRAKKYEKSRRNSLAFYCFLRDNIDDIRFLAIGVAEKDLNRVERHYINKYKPAFNYSGVQVAYLPVERIGA